MKTTIIILTVFCSFALSNSFAQTCTPLGDQVTYGTNNVWIGYIYQGMDFNTYKGYVTEGTAASPNFDEGFGGGSTYNTNGCSVTTTGFSAIYKLTANLSGVYQITIGGDDGVRLSIDGGNTWLINEWQDQSYTTFTTTVSLSGTTNFVLEYYQDGGANQVSFNIGPGCIAPADNQSIYGTNNVWNGYIYQGMNFNTYRGMVNEGSTASANFNENFGGSGSPITYNTLDGCSIQTQQFSAHYRLSKFLWAGNYTFVVGGDDGYRFSLDGGNTWPIDKWVDQSYNTTTYTTTLTSGTYNMVLDYYQNGGYNQVSFNVTGGVLALVLVSFDGKLLPNGTVQLDWASMNEVNNKYFEVQRSSDGINFQPISQVPSKQSGPMSTVQLDYSYIDNSPLSGNSFYKLKMVDLDGTVTYSNVVSISNNGVQGVNIYPTVLTDNNINIKSSQAILNLRFELYDVSGQKISESYLGTLNGTQNISLSNNRKIAAGTYIVRLSSDNENILTKLIVVQ